MAEALPLLVAGMNAIQCPINGAGQSLVAIEHLQLYAHESLLNVLYFDRFERFRIFDFAGYPLHREVVLTEQPKLRFGTFSYQFRTK
jgi:hypothetical protein